MTIRIATPFSELLNDRAMLESVLTLSDVIELRKPDQVEIDFPSVFHFDLNLVSMWEDSDRNMLKTLADFKRLEMISLHISSRYQKNVVRNNAYHGIGLPYSVDDLKKNATINIEFLRSIFGSAFDILIENNNDLKTDAYQIVTDSTFIADIVYENEIYFLWDVAHSMITAINRNISHDEYYTALPLDRCLQVHLSGFRLKSDGFATDAHEVIQQDIWDLFSNQLSDLWKLKYVTIEYYKNGVELQKQLRKLRKIIENKNEKSQ